MHSRAHRKAAKACGYGSDLEGLLGLVEIGAVELHPWNSVVADFERADRIVFDFDPVKVSGDRTDAAGRRIRELAETDRRQRRA